MKNIALFLILLISSSAIVIAEDDSGFHWPKEIEKKNASVTLYQPQYDAFTNNTLEGRMATVS